MDTAPNYRASKWRWCAFVSLCAYCFLSIAVFSPLHTHSAKGVCSLGGFDHQFSEPVEAADTVPFCTFLSRLPQQPTHTILGLYGFASVDSRAPPRAFFLSIP